MPRESAVTSATVNGERGLIGGAHHDTVTFATTNETRFEIVGHYN